MATNRPAQMLIDISANDIKIDNLDDEEFKTTYGFECPTGARGRNSVNTLYRENTCWESKLPLRDAIAGTYEWIAEQVKLRDVRSGS